MPSDAPRSDEVEVSLFGPGVGECVVAHLGAGHWVIVDSCRHRGSRRPVALEYLETLGVDVASAVRLVVATHAHDDHISGIADVFEACTSAQFVHPAASEQEDFRVLLELDKQLADMRQRAYAEYSRVFDLLAERKAASGKRAPRLAALEGGNLYTRDARPPDPGAYVLALSPSNAAVALALQEFRARLPAEGQPPTRGPRDPNTFCAALWIECGEVRIILGSDLLAGPGTDCGWRGVLASPVRSQQKASCYKVAHHGAPNADLDEIWTDLLTTSPIALLAPYRAGRVIRPGEADRQRICGWAPNAYITGKPAPIAQADTVRRQAARLRSIAKDVRLARGEWAQVRARRSTVDASSDWEVELIGHARALCTS